MNGRVNAAAPMGADHAATGMRSSSKVHASSPVPVSRAGIMEPGLPDCEFGFQPSSVAVTS